MDVTDIPQGIQPVVDLLGLAQDAGNGGRASMEVVPVVGIGASAGGMEVFKRLLGDLPVDTGFALVFIQHLDPNHQRNLAETLAQSTGMPVRDAADGMPVEANHVYVTPANADLIMVDRALRLEPRTQETASQMPIDRFLRSAAEQCGSAAIGVILSGSGSDGSAGVEAIKAAGGVSFAQDAATARFAAMPQAAVATGCVDFVLSPEDIAGELVRIGRHPYIVDAARVDREETPADDEKRFRSILATLHGVTGIDFSLYREQMIKRRIQRRVFLRNIDTLAEYSDRLENDFDELMALKRDLIIGVTSFFRDPASFDCLKKVVFPRIFQGRPANEAIRVWVPGCATGEEAFSIAILFQEYMSEAGAAFPLHIFASDLSQAPIEKARIGKYRENIAADVSHERLSRHFTKVSGGYQVNTNLRDICVFTKHNLIDDPPFSKLDLISCRNVLMYLGRVHKNILPLFHHALKQTGFLMLGASEEAACDLFSEVNRENRIYAKVETSRQPHLPPASDHISHQGEPEGNNRVAPLSMELWDAVGGLKEVDRLLLSQHALAGVVVDQDLQVLEIRGTASPYIVLQDRGVGSNLVKLIPDTELFLEVEWLIRQSWKTGERVQRELTPYKYRGGAGGLNVEVVPLNSSPTRSTLVLFEPVQPREHRQTTNEELLRLNDELLAKNASLAQARDFAMSIVETVRQPLLVLDMDMRIKLANRAFYRTFQSSPLEVEGQVIYSLSRGNWNFPALKDSLDGLLRGGSSFPDFEVQQELPSRSLVIGGCHMSQLNMILLAVDDITERKVAQRALQKSEEHLRQAQKMEAIGRLAGGIAHDFNNLLTAIICCTSLLSDTVASNEAAMQQLLVINTASDRAASLTKQLLAFGRRQVLRPKVLDMNAIVTEFDQILRRLVGERINVVIECEPTLWPVMADSGEIGRAIMNLLLNARDAMPEGGNLIIQTANVNLAEPACLNLELSPGRYVMVAVHDNGLGMEAEVRSRIFEPFFTTKEIGKGTGLGLATVLGIVEQSGGVIHCESQPGEGTTFKIFLPALTEAADETVVTDGGRAMEGKSSEIILLVEDQDIVRKPARQILEASGYAVYEACNGMEGLAFCQGHKGHIDLLVSDVVMPLMGGRELAESALKLRPRMKVMFISGHTEDIVLMEGVQNGTAFLQKPFTARALVQKVRETLDLGALRLNTKTECA